MFWSDHWVSGTSLVVLLKAEGPPVKIFKTVTGSLHHIPSLHLWSCKHVVSLGQNRLLHTLLPFLPSSSLKKSCNSTATSGLVAFEISFPDTFLYLPLALGLFLSSHLHEHPGTWHWVSPPRFAATLAVCPPTEMELATWLTVIFDSVGKDGFAMGLPSHLYENDQMT